MVGPGKPGTQASGKEMSTVWKVGDSPALVNGIVPGSLRRGLPIRLDRLAGLSPTFHTVLVLVTGSLVAKALVLLPNL